MRLTPGMSATAALPATKMPKVGVALGWMSVVTLGAGAARQAPLVGSVWQMSSVTGRLAAPVLAAAVIVASMPRFTVATANTPVPVAPGISTKPGSPLAAKATTSGTGVVEAERFKVSTPVIEVAGLGALAQVKMNATFVGLNAAVGVNATTKVPACPAAMSAGVLAVPVSALVVGSVVWKTKLAGMPVAGAIVQVAASAGPASMIVAKAVGVAPISTERLVGRTAATSVRLPVVFATKLAVTVLSASSVRVQPSMPLH